MIDIISLTPWQVKELLKYGDFVVYPLYGTVSSTLADPTTGYASATVTTVTLKTDWRLIVLAFNWGATDYPAKVYFNFETETGTKFGSTIYKSNLSNDHLHAYVERYFKLWIWNITSPGADIVYDLCMWWYEYRKEDEDKVKKILTEGRL